MAVVNIITTMDPLANAYLKVITESSDDLQSKDQKVEGQSLKVGATFGDSKNDSTVKKIQPKSGPEAEGAETPQAAQEAPTNLSVGKEQDCSPKKLEKTYESNNPFDVLFNKIISEEGEFMDFATSPDENPMDSTFEPSEEDSDEFGESEEEDDETVTLTLSKELAEKLHEALMGVLGESEESEESEESPFENYEDSEEDEDESSEEGAKPFGEAVEAEEEGHALVDAEKLNKGMNSKSNMVVKGAVPVSNKTAQTPTTGKGHDGKLKSHSTEGGVSKLTSKNNNVGGVNVGKTLFDNE